MQGTGFLGGRRPGAAGGRRVARRATATRRAAPSSPRRRSAGSAGSRTRRSRAGCGSTRSRSTTRLHRGRPPHPQPSIRPGRMAHRRRGALERTRTGRSGGPSTATTPSAMPATWATVARRSATPACPTSTPGSTSTIESSPTPHAPVMAEIDLVSSHTPWTPLPRLVPWAQVGDGSVFDPQPAEGLVTRRRLGGSAHACRKLYGESVQYSLSARCSRSCTPTRSRIWCSSSLGDHQPARVVSGPDADHDVPITIIAQDPDGLRGHRLVAVGRPATRPSPDAPVWRMDRFRDRFLDAFSP